MNVTSVFVPASGYVHKWFQLAEDYRIFRQSLLTEAEGLASLHETDKELILEFVARQGWLYQAVRMCDKPFVEALLNAGADVNRADDEVHSLLSHATSPEMFQWLHARQARFKKDEISTLQFLLEQAFNPSAKESVNAGWQKLIEQTIPVVALQEYYTLPSDHLVNLAKMAKYSENVRKLLLNVADRIVKENPDEALGMAKRLFTACGQDIVLMIVLIKMGLLTDPLIGQIVTDPGIMYWNGKNTAFFEALEECWKPVGDLQILIEAAGNFRLGIFIQAILNTKEIKEAAQLYLTIGNYSNTDRWDETLTSRLLNHMIALQNQKKDTIWNVMENYRECNSAEFLQMRELGFEFLWVHPVTRQTYFFTQLVRHLDEKRDAPVECALNHIDLYGNNALEHHCKNFTEHSYSCIKVLVRLGAKLSDRFPNIQKCRKSFPDNHYLQAFLGFILINPHEIKVRLRHVVRQDFNIRMNFERHWHEFMIFEETEEKRPELCEHVDWKDKYAPADAKRLNECLVNRRTKESDLILLASLWPKGVPSEIFTLIPKSPLASLVVASMQVQHQQLLEETKRPPLQFHELICPCLQHDDMVHLNRYLFANPKLVNILVKDYMKANMILIQPGGGSTADYGKIVFLLMKNMGEINHLQGFYHKLPKWHKKLIKAFHKLVPPIPVETLNIPEHANIFSVGRTVVVKSGTACDAFKFLKPGEKYEYFAQEHSVCEALQAIAEQFKSIVIQPHGVYAVKQLPPAFHAHQHQLGGGMKNKFVFHYKAHPQTYEYLQTLPAEKYRDARITMLHDAVRLIRLGIYPDLAALFHNHRQSRRYILLVDLMVCIMREQTGANMFNPAGGAGRLETPFDKIEYPNARLTGMTDWRDAALYYGYEDVADRLTDMKGLGGRDKGIVKYFYQMNALSGVFLIDTLILATRAIKEDELQWQSPTLNQKFGRELAEGFAFLSAFYSGQPHEQSMQFALHCGIDWTLAAKQIAFWLDTGSHGYPSWVVQGKVPPDLYDKSIHVQVNVTQGKNFDKEHGFRTNGKQDIGSYNGPLALDELEKAAHLLFIGVALAEPLSNEHDEHT